MQREPRWHHIDGEARLSRGSWRDHETIIKGDLEFVLLAKAAATFQADVVGADPRINSNLVIDISFNGPAAAAVWRNNR